MVNQFWFIERGLTKGGLPFKYNCRPRFHPECSLKKETVMVHFPGEPKVWDLKESSIKGLKRQTKPLPVSTIELFWKYYPANGLCQESPSV